jgi:hypothetical protein
MTPAQTMPDDPPHEFAYISMGAQQRPHTPPPAKIINMIHHMEPTPHANAQAGAAATAS